MVQQIKFGTWNICLGLSLTKVLSQIENHADFAGLNFLALEEASIHNDKEDSQTIAEQLGKDYLSSQITGDFFRGMAQANGLVWNSQSLKIKDIDTPVLPRHHEVVMPYREKLLLRFGTSQKRNIIISTGRIAKLTLRVYVVHINLLGLSLKSAQMDYLIADIKKRPPCDLTIVLGDFNRLNLQQQKFTHYVKQEIEKVGFRELTEEVHYTHRVGLWKQKLDAIFVKSRQPFRSTCWTLNVPGSDHLPIFANIKI